MSGLNHRIELYRSTGNTLLFTTVNEYVLQTQNILDPAGSIVASKRFEGQAETG